MDQMVRQILYILLQDSFLLLRVLSILIPVYKYDSRRLILSLVECFLPNQLNAEIVVMDDGSDMPPLAVPENMPKGLEYRYIALPQNIGRSAIRNKLAAVAQYDMLLFLDCDSGIPDSGFLFNYLPYLGNKSRVVCGGRIYSPDPPREMEFFLHWKYGTCREARPSSYRNRHPHEGFHSNNFLVPKDLILAYPFDESLKLYGYEDSLWAMELQKAGIPILHIENPVVHLGLESRAQFLEKLKDSTTNLIRINRQGHQIMAGPERFYRRYLKSTGVISDLIRTMLRILKPLLVRQLSGPFPNMLLLDLLRLGYYLELINLDRLARGKINR